MEQDSPNTKKFKRAKEVPISSSHAFAHLEEDSRSTASSFVTVSEDPSLEWWTQWQTLVGVPPSSPLYNITEQANLLHSDDVQIPSQSNAAVISDDHRSPNVKEDKSLPGTPGHVVELSSPSISSRSSSSSSSASSSSSSSTSQTMTPHQPTVCSSQPSIDEVFIPSKENNSTPSTIKLPVTEIPTESTPSSSTDNPEQQQRNSDNAQDNANNNEIPVNPERFEKKLWWN
ncbi:uncharacterized protein LOC131801290 [Musca domestica]|uniref:Uncharacterized protein LOC131801290 n=1 Tax=Musca domestica TaxID=7370 RepID=A0ABM3UQL2_MUSDO|nr:uncharacterized protein LOC131801290 [Musca domestica]